MSGLLPETVKAITCPVILHGAATRSDGSLTLRFVTPELQADEKTALMELINRNLKMLLQPSDSEPLELKEVKGQFDQKTPGQRLRGVLFVLWKDAAESTGEFEEFYRREMAKLIDQIKERLPERTT